MSDKNEMSEEDYLKRHLQDLEDSNSKNVYSDDTSVPEVDNKRISDLQFFNYDVRELPCGRFYPKGTQFMVRPAQVREIQAYSMVDDNNFYDIVEKMNDILKACIRIKYSDGKIGTYLDVKDQDRLFLVFLIRELTFQQGNSLTVNAVCECGEEIQIELKRENFVFFDIDEKLVKFYNESKGSYEFTTKDGKSYELTPPNIGIQKAFTDYIVKENNDKKSPNLSFLKIIPFMLSGRSTITYDGIKTKLKEFELLDGSAFQFVNAAVSKMTFGIKELKKMCECGTEVRSEMQFPNGASGIFVIQDAFEAYIKE